MRKWKALSSTRNRQGTEKKINGSNLSLIYALYKHTMLDFNGYKSLCLLWNQWNYI